MRHIISTKGAIAVMVVILAAGAWFFVDPFGGDEAKAGKETVEVFPEFGTLKGVATPKSGRATCTSDTYPVELEREVTASYNGTLITMSVAKDSKFMEVDIDGASPFISGYVNGATPFMIPGGSRETSLTLVLAGANFHQVSDTIDTVTLCAAR